MKRVVSYGVDILIRNENENAINLEEIITKALEDNGLHVVGVAFIDDLTESYKDELNNL